jgi:putative ABC transport system ATP-binding protein
MADHPLIRLRQVSRIYGAGDVQVRALDNVDLDIDAGDFVAVMGPSGSGKSTCMNIIGCLDTPTSGHYYFRGIDVKTLSADQRALLRRHALGFVFQGFNLLKRTTALENVELPLIYQRVPTAERHARGRAALAQVGLAHRVNHQSSQMSGGEQQRVAIARAIVTNPELLLADEPTGNLDSKRSAEVMELLARLNRDQGITIVMVTHEPDMAAYARRVVTFLDGHIVSDERQSGVV